MYHIIKNILFFLVTFNSTIYRGEQNEIDKLEIEKWKERKTYVFLLSYQYVREVLFSIKEKKM